MSAALAVMEPTAMQETCIPLCSPAEMSDDPLAGQANLVRFVDWRCFHRQASIQFPRVHRICAQRDNAIPEKSVVCHTIVIDPITEMYYSPV